jgi:tRNA threonylcarbamoyl adenosine modification protein YeaZ
MRDGRVIAESFLSLGLTHSETFMPMLHDLMKTAGLKYEELDAFACTVGPGSFTGIRIGVSAMKTMAMVAGKPIVPVSSLRALAFPYTAYSKAPVAALINARNRRVFASAFNGDSEAIPEAALPVEEFAYACREKLGAGELILCGDAAELYAGDEIFAGFTICHPGDSGREIRSSSVAEIAGRSMVIAASTSEHSPETAWMRAFPPDGILPVYRAKTAAERALLRSDTET